MTESIRVLLIEDDPEDYYLTIGWLAPFKGYVVDWVKTYEEAVALCSDCIYDVALIDYRLGSRSGLELMNELSILCPSIPMILLTGTGDSAIDLRAMEAGASDFLVKGSIDSGILERSIRYSIRQKKSAEEIRALNEDLERRVDERTAELTKEIAERKKAQEKYYQLAFYDALTKLPNRELMGARLKQAIKDAERTSKHVAVMFVDLDGFKAINDTHGHLAGDNLLIDVGKRLKGAIRSSDIVCRYGGDEFVVVMANLNDPEASVITARKIIAAIDEAIVSDAGLSVPVTLSLGIALYPRHANTSSELLILADQAMYAAKSKGKRGYAMYAEDVV